MDYRQSGSDGKRWRGMEAQILMWNNNEWCPGLKDNNHF